MKVCTASKDTSCNFPDLGQADEKGGMVMIRKMQVIDGPLDNDA